ncbi:hypothetical protein BRADI_1g46780v3 [Brachypodium distachyon]|uniref:RNA helicase n=1 Tax=Brachypodium distachyon TaxID=15368 RepID=I1H053_BRADI|nr:hypothetical protein BRADI_1g46780v3 [Brachypodium distachyon]
MPSFSSGASPQKQQHNARRKQLIRQQRKSLPIASVEKRLVEEVKKNDTLIVVVETGSGKTTCKCVAVFFFLPLLIVAWIKSFLKACSFVMLVIIELPQFLYDAGFCQDAKVIGITQPRRVAAVTVAKRVAEECNDQLGKKVGYSIRFDDSTSNATRIKYMTDGLLLRTQYPLDTLYTYQPESDYLDATLVTIFQILLEEGPGDILAFLTGQEEIESLERLIQERARQLPPDSTKIWTTPIYSSLPSEQQMNAFKPAQAGARKVDHFVL